MTTVIVVSAHALGPGVSMQEGVGAVPSLPVSALANLQKGFPLGITDMASRDTKALHCDRNTLYLRTTRWTTCSFAVR